MRIDSGKAAYLQYGFFVLASAAILLILLTVGRFVLVPLAIAILLFSLMDATITRITHWRLGPVRVPVWIASVAVVMAVAGAIFSVMAILYTQLNEVITAGPQYVDRIEQQVAALFLWLGEDMSRGVQAAFEDIDLATYVRTLAGSAGNILATSILIMLYVGFLFAESKHWPHKLIRLFPNAARARRFSHVYRSITRSVHRYILVKSIVSVATGIIVYGVMRLFGLNFAETLAMLTVFLNFIPNIGSIVATLIPTLVALVQFDSWLTVVALFTIIGALQFSVGNIIEPALMGRSLHLSSFVIILSLTFWGAVWGVTGMFLAVPIMVMIMIVCSHVPSLHPLAVLLSRDGRLPAINETTENRPT